MYKIEKKEDQFQFYYSNTLYGYIEKRGNLWWVITDKNNLGIDKSNHKTFYEAVRKFHSYSGAKDVFLHHLILTHDLFEKEQIILAEKEINACSGIKILAESLYEGVGAWIVNQVFELEEKVAYAYDTNSFWAESDTFFCPCAKVNVTKKNKVNCWNNPTKKEEISKYALDRGLIRVFHDEETRDYYNEGKFEPIRYNRHVVCRSRKEKELGRILFEWSDGNWRIEPEPEEQIPSHGRLPYHKYNRPKFWYRKFGYGIEIELYCPGKTNNDTFCHEMNEAGIITEVDGSLCREFGVECVGAPYTLYEYQNGKTAWEKAWGETEERQKNIFTKHKCSGFNAGIVDRDAERIRAAARGDIPDRIQERMYGIHVSVSKKLFSKGSVVKNMGRKENCSIHIAKFCIAINNMATLGKIVAQREKIYTTPEDRAKCEDGYKERVCIKEFLKEDKVDNRKFLSLATKHHEAVSIKKEVVEVRIFKSNLKKERVLKNIEFCDAIKNWCQYENFKTLSDEDKATKSFLDWLIKNKACYPNLCLFLAKNPVGMFSVECMNLEKKNPDPKKVVDFTTNI